jgi:diguanylate cyclase
VVAAYVSTLEHLPRQGVMGAAAAVAAHQILLAVGGLLAGWLARSALLRRQLLAAGRDPVTGLATRQAWTVRARRILRGGGMVALIDLNQFKEINDRFGHAAGDHFLAVTASRIVGWLESAGGGACGRLGGDEFSFATRYPAAPAELDRLAAALAAPVRLPGGASAAHGASIGTARCQPGRAGLPTALAAADSEMYAAKRAGGGWRIAPDCGLPPSPPRRRPGRRRRAPHHGADPVGEPGALTRVANTR